MKLRGTRSTIAVVTTLVTSALVLTALVAVIGSAQAAPQKKVFNATVDVQNASTLTSASARLRLTLSNDASSNQTLGSANFVAPAGVTFSAGPLGTNRTGWTATAVGNVVQFRSTSSPLTISTSVYADVDVAINATTCFDATWTAFAKQSNDFSGSGNDFTPGTATNRRPLGSLDIAQIETVVPPDPPTFPDELHVPQILTNENKDVLVTARDVCGDLYTNYGTSAGRATVLTKAAPDVPPRLVGAGDLALSGSSSTVKTTLNPKVVETGDQLVVTDSLTTPGQSIGDASNVFDVVQELCTSHDETCELNNGKVRVFGDGPPGQDDPNKPDPSLGFGFFSSDLLTVQCLGDASAVSPIAGTVVNINPRDYPNNNPITITVIYKKSDTGNGPATGFGFCLSKDNLGTWGAPLTECPSNPQESDAPCVSRKRVTGGDLSAAFWIHPTDPWGTGR
jgi:hypothetical protein